MYVSKALFDWIARDQACGGMIVYVGEWHEEVPIL